MLLLAIVVNGDAAAAHIYAAADIAIANIGKMGQLGAFAHVGVFNLYIVANLHMVANHSIRAQMYIGTGRNMVLNLAVMTINKLQMVIIADFYIGKTGVGTDFAVLTDDRVALQPSVGIDNSIAADFYAALDKGAGRVHNGNTAIHQLIQNTLTHHALSYRKLLAGVDAHHHIAVLGNHTAHLLAGLVQLLQHIGEIIFTLCIIIGQGSEHIKHQGAFHAIDAGVDFLNSLLLLGSILLLHNGLYITLGIAHNAAIAKGVVHDCG